MFLFAYPFVSYGSWILFSMGAVPSRYDPDDRILARQALRDPYFRELHEMKKEAMETTGR